jgi:glycosyltransferase involved in cell wall biosynthesis
VLGYAAVHGRAAGITGVERKVQRLLDGLGFAQYVVYPAAGRLAPSFRTRAAAMLERQPQRRFDGAFARALAEFARRHDVDVVVSMGLRHDFHAALACRSVGVPLLVHRPVPLADEPIPALRRHMFGLVDAWTLRHCAGIIACSEASALRMARTQRIARRRIRVVVNGVPVPEVTPAARASARQRLGAEPGDVVVGAAGQLIARKGFADLVRAVAHLQGSVSAPARGGAPSVRCVVLGEGPEHDALQALAHQLHVDLLLPGFVEDPGALIAGFDVAVLPSYAEGMPQFVLEAMALGVPTIATRVAGAPEVIVDSVSGMLVPPGNIGALSGALARLGSDAALRQRIGRAGAERVRRHFSLDAMLEGFAVCFRLAASGTTIGPA